jgi:ABC-type xylose transport system permease subunit
MSALIKLKNKPWIWSFVAMAAVWIATVVFTGGSSAFGLSHAALTFAAFSVIVGLGQMFVITLGPGNIDLCVPATMTLSATVALKIMDVSDSMIAVGLLIAVLIGAAIGVGNYALIKILRIPPIIATLSMSFIVQSAAIWYNRGLRVKPPQILADFAVSSTFAIPNVAWVALILSCVGWVLLDRNIYGRWISAIGQSMFAARMTGIPVSIRGRCWISPCQLFRWSSSEHGRRIFTDVDCGRCYRRYCCCWRRFQHSRYLGRVPFHVPRRLHAQYLWSRCRGAPHSHWLDYHFRYSSCWRP